MTEDWWKKMLSDDVSETFWKKDFRMGKDAFRELFTMLDPYTGPRTTPNYRKLSISKKLAMVLYYLKDTGSLLMSANGFGVHRCTVFKTFVSVCEAISEILGSQNSHEMREGVRI